MFLLASTLLSPILVVSMIVCRPVRTAGDLLIGESTADAMIIGSVLEGVVVFDHQLGRGLTAIEIVHTLIRDSRSSWRARRSSPSTPLSAQSATT